MARLNFRQGIVRRQDDGVGNPANLLPSNGGSYVDIIVSPDPTVFTIAHFDVDYLFSENATVTKAWGPFTSGTDYWLYWDIDFITGELTRQYTTVEPTFGPTAPTSPVIDLHWFDTTNGIMKVWSGSLWTEKLRVFAAKYQQGATIVDYPEGTQVGIFGFDVFAGTPLFDPDGKPLQQFQRDRRGRFITTETELHGQFSRIANFRVEAAIITGSAQENIPIHYAITYSDYNKLVLARNTEPTRPAIGIAAEEMNTGEARAYITKGFVTNPIDWDWSAYPVNTPLYVGASGELTPIIPLTGLVQKIARVVSPDTIFVEPSQSPINLSAGSGNYVSVAIDRDTGMLTARETSSSSNTGGTSVCSPPTPTALCAWGFTHYQYQQALSWTIEHNCQTERVIADVFDVSGNKILPSEIIILDINTVRVDFSTPESGHASLVLLTDQI